MTKKQNRKAKQATKKRYRVQHRFWLDITRDDEFTLDEQLAETKKKRGFASTLRNSLRLWFDLLAGNTDVLCELFPWIEAKIMSNRAGDRNDQLLEEFRRLLIEQGGHNIPSAPNNYPQHKPAASGAPRPLNVPKLVPVVIDSDDDQDTIVLKRSTSTDASLNLLNSMLSLQ